MSLEDEQKRENRHIELIRALDRIARHLSNIFVILFVGLVAYAIWHKR